MISRIIRREYFVMFLFPVFDAFSDLYPAMFPRNNNPWAILQAQTNEQNEAVEAERSSSQHGEFTSDDWPLNIIEDKTTTMNRCLLIQHLNWQPPKLSQL